MFIIIDPSLKNQSGHQYIYTRSLQCELEREGEKVYVLGSRLAQQPCLEMKNFFPAFSDIPSQIFKLRPSISGICALFKLIVSLKDEFDDFFFKQRALELEKNSILYLHTFYIFELISFGWFLRKRAELFKGKDVLIFIGCNFAYKRKSGLETLVFIFLYRMFFLPLVRH